MFLFDKCERMPLGRTALLKAIQGVCDANSAGPFACAKTYSGIPNPGLQLAHFGNLGIPVSQPEAERLLAVGTLAVPVAARLAPFGTVGDEKTKQNVAVSHTPKGKVKSSAKKATPVKEVKPGASLVDAHAGGRFEIGAAKIALKNSKWNEWLKMRGQDVCRELGVQDVSLVVPSLNRLLLYPKGCHIEGAQLDTEKGDNENIFATMVVVLPSSFMGGKIVAEHMGKTKTLDVSHSAEFSEFDTGGVLAWFADLKYRVEKVTQVVRICLVYDLAYEGTRRLPRKPNQGLVEPQRVVVVVSRKSRRFCVPRPGLWGGPGRQI